MDVARRCIKHEPAHVYLEYPTRSGLREWGRRVAKSHAEAAFLLGYMAANFYCESANLHGIYLIFCDRKGSLLELDATSYLWKKVKYDPNIEKLGTYEFPP